MAAPQLEIHEEAEAEASRARLWYEERDPDAARRFLASLDHAIEQITTAPHRWATYLHGTHRYVLKDFPYVVIYRERQAGIEILAVAHGKRRPGYWQDRL